MEPWSVHFQIDATHLQSPAAVSNNTNGTGWTREGWFCDRSKSDQDCQCFLQFLKREPQKVFYPTQVRSSTSQSLLLLRLHWCNPGMWRSCKTSKSHATAPPPNVQNFAKPNQLLKLGLLRLKCCQDFEFEFCSSSRKFARSCAWFAADNFMGSLSFLYSVDMLLLCCCFAVLWISCTFPIKTKLKFDLDLLIGLKNSGPLCLWQCLLSMTSIFEEK